MASNKSNTIILYISSFISVIIGVGTSVLNTHSLTVTEYGDVRYINNFISFFSSIFLFGFFISGARLLAITKDKTHRREINGIMIIMLGIASIMTCLAMSFCYVFHLYSSKIQLANLFLISVPICSSQLMLNYINNTFQGENRIINLSIARCIPGLLYLLLGYIIYQNISASSSLMLLLQNGILLVVNIANILYTKPSFNNLGPRFRELWEENKRYGIQVYLGSMFAVSFSYLAGIFLGIFGDDNSDVGFFMLATTIVTPLTILPAIVGTSYFREFASVDKINNKLLRGTVILSVVSFLGFILLVYPVVYILYDDSYSTVASIAIFLSFGSISHGVGDMFNRFLGAHGMGKSLRNGAIICGAILLSGNIILVYFWGTTGAILTRVLASLSYLLSMIYYYLSFRQSCIKAHK